MRKRKFLRAELRLQDCFLYFRSFACEHATFVFTVAVGTLLPKFFGR
jgi:hypothetical protein